MTDKPARPDATHPRGSGVAPLFVGLFVGALMGVLAGGLVGRTLWGDPPSPPAKIIQPPTGGPNAALLYLRYESMLSDQLLEAAANHDPDQPLPPELTRYLGKHQEAIAGFLRAGRMEHCDFNVEHEMGIDVILVHLGLMRGAAQVVGADIRRCAAAGDVEGATARIECLLSMTKHLRSDRTMLSCLVGSAIAALATDEIERLGINALDEAQRSRLVTALAFIEEDDPLGCKAALAGEKLMALETDVVQSGGFVMDRTAASLGRLYDDAIAAWDDENAQQRLAEIVDNAGGLFDASAMFVPALKHYKKDEQMMLTRLRDLRAELAAPDS